MRPNSHKLYQARTFTGPALRVTPANGSLHSNITVVGTGFPPNDSVTVYVGTRYIGAIYAANQSVTTDTDGTFSLQFTPAESWPDDLPIPEDFIVIAGVSTQGQVEAGELFFVEEEEYALPFEAVLVG